MAYDLGAALVCPCQEHAPSLPPSLVLIEVHALGHQRGWGRPWWFATRRVAQSAMHDPIGDVGDATVWLRCVHAVEHNKRAEPVGMAPQLALLPTMR